MHIRGLVRTQSNIYDGAFLAEKLMAYSRKLVLQKGFIINVGLGLKYASAYIAFAEKP